MVVNSIQIEIAYVHEKKHEKPAAAGPCFKQAAADRLTRYSTPACCAKGMKKRDKEKEQ
jgi:hypothetical protein